MCGRFWIGAVLAITVLLAAPACGFTDGRPATRAVDSSPSSRALQARVPVTVFAAASLTESFNELQATLTTSEPPLSVAYSFAGSGPLVTQIRQGAPADVIATADTDSMKYLADEGLVEAPTIFARNKLEILVAPRNPKGIASLADLARKDIKLVVADETVPAGRYTAQILQKAGVIVKPVSKEADVKSAVAKVTSGEADVTIVYVTDVKAAEAKGDGVVIPDPQNVVAEYPIAIVKDTKNHAGATAFVDEVLKGNGQAVLFEHGFLSAH